MSRRVFVLVFALGCGGSSEKETKSCERAITLCGYDEGADTCIKDIRETKEAMGDSYGKFLDCSVAAKTCGEYIGCAVGGLGAEGMQQLDGLRRGMEKMMGGGMSEQMRDAKRTYDKGVAEMEKMRDDHLREAKRMRDKFGGGGGKDAPIAPECKRADDVCGPDDAERAADKCNSAIGNVKADPENRAKFVSCLASAKNCYAFNDCADQLWFDLN